MGPQQNEPPHTKSTEDHVKHPPHKYKIASTRSTQTRYQTNQHQQQPQQQWLKQHPPFIHFLTIHNVEKDLSDLPNPHQVHPKAPATPEPNTHTPSPPDYCCISRLGRTALAVATSVTKPNDLPRAAQNISASKPLQPPALSVLAAPKKAHPPCSENKPPKRLTKSKSVHTYVWCLLFQSSWSSRQSSPE